MSDDARLARIEMKLDEVGQAVVSLARVEERLITLFNRLDRIDSEQSEHNKRIRLVEGKVVNNGQMLRFAERVFWILITAGVAFAFNRIKGS
jgi:hypothetical protein